MFLRDGFDPNAWAYIQAVESADGQKLEADVRRAYGRFVRGCKVDGIWSAIKASCIMAGARTLSGALVPLVGSAPTNINFVSGDYNRITGLKGDGSTKRINTNRNNNSDPQNNRHMSIWSTVVDSTPSGKFGRYIAGGNLTASPYSFSVINTSNSTSLTNMFFSCSGGNESNSSAQYPTTGFFGCSRSSSANFIARGNNVNTTFNITSQPPGSGSFELFGWSADGGTNRHSDSRMSFYSIGESLNLALLSARISRLMTDISSALS
jgi:hypothetical protein